MTPSTHVIECLQTHLNSKNIFVHITNNTLKSGMFVHLFKTGLAKNYKSACYTASYGCKIYSAQLLCMLISFDCLN